MSGEIRIKQKNLIILLGFVLLVIFLIQSRKCREPSAVIQEEPESGDDLPIIYAITPTYYRPVQKAELTRLSQTIMLVPNIYWVIVEDADEVTELVTNVLKRSGLYKRSVQLTAKTPDDLKLKQKDPHWSKPRGVDQRNTALEWVKQRIVESSPRRTIVYFMDDDNAYSVQLFKEMSNIELGRVGVWPVGLVGGLMVEKPIVDENNVVTGFNAAWRPERQFPIDMAGFAISGSLFMKFPSAKFSADVERGYQETEILRHITTVNRLQPLANGCTEVLVWHTRTEAPKLREEEKLKKQGKRSDEGMEV
ncbi:galactosylgalactosylxylosylprotein 3-beta-glucuronosyltransferase I [Culicoides brevitarsis]|uniref:galactosylgalactosylxylosylprotein 3-beta-glucuronosyltransferase I n=1 Tax=Culicoides brevitarsis TaxID=469753 RepID=UPI00307B569D